MFGGGAMFHVEPRPEGLDLGQLQLEELDLVHRTEVVEDTRLHLGEDVPTMNAGPNISGMSRAVKRCRTAGRACGQRYRSCRRGAPMGSRSTPLRLIFVG
jgi:hypothetical protein